MDSNAAIVKMVTMADAAGASYHCLTCASGKRNKDRTQHSRQVHPGEDVNFVICAGDDCRHCMPPGKFHERSISAQIGIISAKLTVFAIDVYHSNVPVEVRSSSCEADFHPKAIGRHVTICPR